MRLFDWIKRKTSTSTRTFKGEEQRNEEKHETIATTLGELAKNEHTYWKFSQSQSGRSAEPVYIQYIAGEVTIAEDDEKFLSFVNEDNIAKCYMYGDVLTKFCFDMQNENFVKICDEKYHYIGGGLGEYESQKLLVEANYSLKEMDTIVMLIKMVKQPSTFISFYKSFYGPNLEQRLRKYEYNETADFMSYIRENHAYDSLEGAKEIINKIDAISKEFLESR
ncbi:hypothetical protein [Anaerocolumna chitinilytica]|uniref:DUF4375 domain-containing protein n=1 Tax=Anaerocolumna chitinilytica TaxID=1727145 RepID=A0A7I8DGR9_9FIRM|nr:hypothetical protein [Anaerocolumna chitinilytica]BCJ97580.1 hypothetical protein bsdcttw_06210 [Anaerocolumna chitinilytica]